MKNFAFYSVLVILALGLLIGWRKWVVDIQESASGNQDEGMRIISVSPNITEILFALDLGDNVVGVTDFCNYPQEALEKQSIGTIMDPDLEMILSLKATDVFVTNTSFHITLGERLRDMGMTVHVLDVDKMDGISESIIAIGEVADCVEKSRALNTKIKTGLDEIKARADHFEVKPKVLIVIQPEPIIAAGKNTYIDEILTLAGGENVIVDTDRMYPMINAEALIELDPDVIVETVVGVQPERNDIALSHYKWDISAVKNKNVFVIGADKLSRPGPRVVEAASQMQEIVAMMQGDNP
ncbi:MAG: ABC transporter substrate-binding protein [Sedimentisphaeraceae bacterium JB056]